MAYIDNVNKVLNIQPEAAPTRVRLSQNENGRNLYFTLAGNENPIPSGVTVTISGTKPDGTVYSGTGSISNDVVLIPETVQLTAVAGVWDAKVKITSGGNTVATGRIRFLIDADTVAPGSVPSSSVLEGLVEQAQQYAETARQEAYGSPLTAALASDMTDKTRVYVYTGSESGYTAGHWYYWNGSAWTDGGVYNSTAVQTDKTLSLMDVPADGKAVGDAIATDKTLTISDAPADALVVGEKLALIKEMIAGVEVTSTATKAYAIGDLVIVGDVLYKMTKAITSGTQIGLTNAQKTTIADMLEYEITDLKSKLYERIGDLDSEQTAIKGMIAGIESGYTATKNYNVGDLLIVESSLYKATAAIASGSPINASNVVTTTIASVLTSLKGDLAEYKSAVGYNALAALDRHTGTISSSDNWGSLTNDNYQYVLVPIKPDDVIDLGNGTGTGLLYAVLQGYNNPVSGDTAPFSSDTAYNHRLQLGVNTDTTFIAPDDAEYLYILVKENGNDKNILTLAVNGIDMLVGITNVIDGLQAAKVDKRKADPLINSAQDIKFIFEWEQYGLESAGTNSTNANQIRTKYFVWCNAGTKFEKLSGNTKNIGIAKYSDKTGTLIAYEYWKSSYTLDEDCYVRLALNNYTDLANVWDTISIDLISSEFFIHNSQLINAINAKMQATSNACGVSGFDIDDFQIGNITYTSDPWTYAASNVRVCTKAGTYIRLLAGTKVSIAEGYRAYFGGVVNGALFESGWVTGAYVIRQTGDYTVIISFVTQSKVGFYVENAVGALSMTTARTIADMSGGILGLNADGDGLIPNQTRRPNLSGERDGFNVNPPLLTIAHGTDVHGNAEAFSRYMTWCNAHADYIDDMIITGDIIQKKYDDSLDFFTSINGHENVLLVLGNHDQASGIDGATGDNYMSEADAYDKYFAPFIANWGLTWYQEGKTYWYKDYANPGIRLIGLNTNYRTANDAAAQIDWLADVLAVAKTNNLAVVIAEHYPINNPVKFNCNFTAIDNPVSSTRIYTGYCDAVKTFMQNGGEFICWFAGHSHCDYILTSELYADQLCLVNTCLPPSDAFGDTARILSERSQDAINLLSFDRTSKTIKIMRIGANSDLYLRNRNTLTINYQTKEIVSSN